MLFLNPRASELQLLQKHSITCKGASSLGLHILPREATPEFHTAQRDHHPHRCCCYPDRCSRPAVHHHAPCLQNIAAGWWEQSMPSCCCSCSRSCAARVLQSDGTQVRGQTKPRSNPPDEGMNDKWSRDSFLLGSSSVDNHGGYLRCFFFPTLLGW
jgi:hypothetical protein